MLVHRVFHLVKKIAPPPLARGIRAFFTMTLTPFFFSYKSGHYRSALLSKAVDQQGQPIPWYTYPANQFLAAKQFSDCTVLEFGAGQSTLWWSQRAKQIVSLESDRTWYEHLQREVRSANVELHYLPDDLTGWQAAIGDRHFDVIVIDGLDRFKASQIVTDLLKPNGFILLDNAEGSWGEEGTYPIIDWFYARGFRRIDFYGHAPGVMSLHCTSLFYKDDTFVLHDSQPPTTLSVYRYEG